MIAFSPDGRFLAVARGRELRVVDGSTYRRIQVIRRPRGQRVWEVAFSPDGSILAASISDPDANRSWLMTWSTTDWSPQWELKQDPRRRRRMEGITFAPDGSQLAANVNGEVVLADATTGELQTTLSGVRRFGSRRLRFTPDGRLWSTSIRQIIAWDLASGERVHHRDLELREHGQFDRGEFDVKRGIAVLAGQGRVNVVELNSWRAKHVERISDAFNWSDMAYHHGQGLIAHGSHTVRLLDHTGKLLWQSRPVGRGRTTASALAFDPAGRRLVIGDDMGWVQVVDVDVKRRD